MAPYDFAAPDADIILRSSDGKEFLVHKLILSLASPVFQGTFDLPQPTRTPPSEISIVSIPEPSDILGPFLQYLYPRSPPEVSDLAMWAALCTIADKYDADVVIGTLRNVLIPRFLDTSPLRVYALASRWGFEEEAKIASRRTLTIDLLKDFPREDAELMDGVACQKLYHLHASRQAAARAFITNHPLPERNRYCHCSQQNYTGLVQSLCQRVGTIPWLTAEGMYEDIAKWDHPTACGNACHNSIRSVNAYFSSLLKGVSELPQTI